jgi:uncharacterized protein (DUF433 family)
MIRAARNSKNWRGSHHMSPTNPLLSGTKVHHGKWFVVKDENILHVSPISEWDRPFSAKAAAPRPVESLSNNDIFQQAAAKVEHKIQINRRILGGAPCVRGTRIPVYAILELLEAGYTHKRILKSFPALSSADLEASIRFAIYVMER